MQVVLVVDDNAAVRMIIADFLAYNLKPVKVLQAVDGLEGVALVKQERPHLILLDAEMPNMNGYEAAQQLRSNQETSHIPIVAISSGPDNNPVVSGLRALADACLPKPFSPDELLKLVRQLCTSSHISA